MKQKNINIRIGRIDVQGIEARHRGDIQRAIQEELNRLVARGGLPSSWRGGNTRRALSPVIGSSSNPSHIGRAIARSIYQGGK